MGCRTLVSKGGDCCFYCSTTMFAFGPVFESEEEAEAFREFLDKDPRFYTDNELDELLADMRKKNEEEEEEK